MSFLPFLHFCSLIVCLYFAIFILIRNPRSSLNRAAAAFCACFVLWSFGKIFVHSPYVSRNSANLFENVASLGWVNFSYVCLWFVLVFTKRAGSPRTKLMYLTLLILPLTFIYKQWTGALIIGHTKQYYGWGNVWADSIWPYLFALYYLSFVILGLYLIFEYRKSNGVTRRKQCDILFWAILTSLIIGSCLDVVFPMLKVRFLPELADVVILIWISAIIYVTAEYRLLPVTPATAADNILSTMSDCLLLLDEDGNIVTMNKAALELLGCEPGDLKGEPASKLFETTDLEGAILDEVIRTGRIENYELLLKTRGGRNIPVIFSASVLRDEADELAGIVCVARNITGRKQAEEALQKSKEKLQYVIDNTWDIVFEIDLEGNYTLGNKAAERVIGYPLEKLLKMNMRELIAPEYTTPVFERLKRRIAGEYLPQPFDFEIIHRKGHRVWIELTTSGVYRDGKLVAIQGIARDVTERKHAERRLSKLNECFLSLGPDPKENIEIIVHTAGDILNGASMLYDRLDRERGLLCTWAIWHEPEGFDPEDNPEGHICYDVIRNGREGPVIFEDLQGTKYEKTDPHVRKYGLQSYLGYPVKLKGEVVGALCLCDVEKRKFTDQEIRIVGLLAQAVGVEEERKLAEEELRKHRDQLEQLVEDRTVELRRVNKELQKDIEGREKAEKALRESEEFSSSLLENSPNPILVINEDTSVKFVNPALERLTGFSSSEIVGKKAPYPWWTEEALKDTSVDLKEAMRKGETRLEEHFTKKNGERFWVEVTSGPVRGNGKFKYYLINWVDITERKRSEEELLRYALIYRSMDEALTVSDREGITIDANPAAEKMFGWTREEMVGKRTDMINPPELTQKVSAAIMKSLRQNGVWRGEIPLLTKSGERRTLLTIISCLRDSSGKWIGNIGINRDITDRKMSEEALRESEEFSSSLLENSPNPILVINEDTSVKFVNPALERLTGFSSSEIVGKKTPYPWWTEEMLKDTSVDLKEAMRKGATGLEKHFKKKNGERFWVEITSRPVKSKGIFRYYLATWVDITDRKRIIEALRQSEEKYRLLLNEAGDAILLSDTNGNLLEANKRAEELLGYTKWELLEKHVKQIHPDNEAYLKKFNEIVRKGSGSFIDGQVVRKDGTTVPVDMTGSVIRYGDVCVVQGIFRDITERKNVERMKENLIRNFSHELKTPIAMMKMSSEICRRAIKSGDMKDVKKAHAMIGRSLERLAKNVGNVLELAMLRKKSGRITRIDLRPMVGEIIKDLGHPIEVKRLAVNVEIPKEAHEVTARRSDIRTLFYNIIDNAVKFTERGCISIKTGRAGRWIEIVIKDTGRGIRAKDRGRVFERFHQSHAAIPGTGLGLSICKEIVESYGGTIEISSEGPRKGTSVIIRLPRRGLKDSQRGGD